MIQVLICFDQWAPSIAPAMYIIANSIKTIVWMKEVKIIRTKTGKGTRKGTSRTTTARTLSSP